MTRTEIQETLRDILEKDRGEKVEHFDEDARLREDVGLDSVDVISLVVEIQARFDMNLTIHDLEQATVVRDLLNVLEAKLVPRAAA
jgi:acyl carrier protein